MKNYTFFISFSLLINTCLSAQKVTLIVKKSERKVDVLADGKPFTSFIFPSDTVLKKHSLYPIYTAKGTILRAATRLLHVQESALITHIM